MPSRQLEKTSISIRCTLDEHKQINLNAQAHGMSTSEYVRFIALNAKITVKATK